MENDMKVTNIAPRDVYITMELSLSQVGHILDYLTNAKIRYDDNGMPIGFSEESDQYTKKTFFEELRKAHEYIEGNYDGLKRND